MKYPRFHGNYSYLKTNPTNIDALSLSLIPKNSKVLEIGCGDARLTKYLVRYLNCDVVIVEKDADNALNAKEFAEKIIVGDAETVQVQKKIACYGSYDVVYASAVIASFVDPEQFLKKMKQWLKKDHGFVVITFSNIVHWSFRKEIIWGRFTYSSSGLCSREHLHFYTLISAQNLVTKAGYKIETKNFDYVGLPVFEKISQTLPSFRKLFHIFYQLLPSLFTYQFVFKLRPKI